MLQTFNDFIHRFRGVRFVPDSSRSNGRLTALSKDDTEELSPMGDQRKESANETDEMDTFVDKPSTSNAHQIGDFKDKLVLIFSSTFDSSIAIATQLLSDRGYEHQVISNKDELTESLRKVSPLAIFIDMRNSKLNGSKPLDFVSYLKHDLKYDGVLIALTERSLCDRRSQLITAGFHQAVRPNNKQALNQILTDLEDSYFKLLNRSRLVPALCTALDHTNTPVEVTDNNDRVLFVNSAYEHRTGCLRADVLGTLSSDLRRRALPRTSAAKYSAQISQSIEREVSPNHRSRSHSGSEHQDQGKHTTVLSHLSFRDHDGPLVHVKIRSSSVENYKPYSVTLTGSKKRFSLCRSSSSIEAPVIEILNQLKGAYELAAGTNPEVQKQIKEAMHILCSTDPFAPVLLKLRPLDDKLAEDLFDGLVLNGPARVAKSRKQSLSDAMRNTQGKKDHTNGSPSAPWQLRSVRGMSPQIAEILQSEAKWDFDVLKLETVTKNRPLVFLGMKILERLKVRDFLHCTEHCLRLWLETIESHYHTQNPYHNATHAADVLQATTFFLQSESIANILSLQDGMAAVLAAIIHDLDHPGKGNGFLINTRHSMAILYNDVSVLENHHASFAFQLTLKDPRINIFAHLGRSDFTVLRKSIVDMVLATDMNRHFELLAKFKSNVLASEEETDGETIDVAGVRQTICRMMIKCADVSNPARPFAMCKVWGYRIVEEYFRQTAEERAKGLPLTMEAFDRETCNVPLTQIRFIDMFIKEMFEGWSNFLDIDFLMPQILDNYTKWEAEVKTWPEQRQIDFETFLPKSQSIEREDLHMDDGAIIFKN